jgi:dephospho-CoA kinase
MIVLGLTGSIGMGKSTTSAMFAEAGVPVWDADAAVHRLYGPGGAAVGPIAKAFPAAVRDNQVARAALRDEIANDPKALERLNAIVHPLVAADRQAFLDAQSAQGTPIVLLDVPLLLETGTDALCDHIIVVSTDPDTQRARVMARPGMTDEMFATLLSRQMPDAEKRARADVIIETDTLDHAREQVQTLLNRLNSGS